MRRNHAAIGGVVPGCVLAGIRKMHDVQYSALALSTLQRQAGGLTVSRSALQHPDPTLSAQYPAPDTQRSVLPLALSTDTKHPMTNTKRPAPNTPTMSAAHGLKACTWQAAYAKCPGNLQDWNPASLPDIQCRSSRIMRIVPCREARCVTLLCDAVRCGTTAAASATTTAYRQRA